MIMIWPYRLVWFRTSGFHPENWDSNSHGAAIHPKYHEVIKLRKRGKSYREIAKVIGLSKNSVSRWCKNLKLPLSAQKILEKKNNYPKELFRKYNQVKAKKVRMENKKIEKEAAKEICTLSQYDLKLIGATLYWGEGQKRWSSGGQRIHFVNSEPSMIALFLCFLREIIQVPEKELRVSIRVHPILMKKQPLIFGPKSPKFQENIFLSLIK